MFLHFVKRTMVNVSSMPNLIYCMYRFVRSSKVTKFMCLTFVEVFLCQVITIQSMVRWRFHIKGVSLTLVISFAEGCSKLSFAMVIERYDLFSLSQWPGMKYSVNVFTSWESTSNHVSLRLFSGWLCHLNVVIRDRKVFFYILLTKELTIDARNIIWSL